MQSPPEAREWPITEDHLSEDTVLRFLRGTLREGTLAAAELHVHDCAECLELLAAAGSADLGVTASAAPEGGPQPAPAPRVSGARIGQYQLHECLGEGGMGVVYRAWAHDSRRWVALKRVRLARPAAVGSLRREVHALGRIQHPGVVRVFEQGIADGLPWYTMELIDGDTLDSRIRALHGMAPSPITWKTVVPLLRVIRRLCHTLAYLHGEGIVHRDLTPKNVVIQSGETPVLVDFGLSSLSPSAGREGVDHVEGGTPWYMAPEQIEHELVDARADLYALGCVLYELFTGRTPFPKQSTSNPTVLLRAIAEAPLPPPPTLSGLPSELLDLTMNLLAKKPGDRLGYAADVAAALDRAGVTDNFAWPAPPARSYLYRPGLVARGACVQALETAVSACAAGVGGCLTVAGDSGIGKTRLLLVAAARARTQRVRVVTAACFRPAGSGAQGAGAPPPLNAFRPLLQTIADLCRQRGAALTERLLGRRGHILATIEPALRQLPVDHEVAPPPPLSGEAARFRLFEALHDTLESFAAAGAPLLLVIDDLQWMDDVSMGFLERLDPEFLERTGILLIGSYRSEEVPAALQQHLQGLGTTHLLERLTDGEIAGLVANMLAVRHPDPGLITSLSRLSQGNPYFVTEYLRMLVDRGWLGRDPGGQWSLTSRGTEALERAERLPTPLSLAEVLAARLSQLSPSARRVAQFASVLGNRFSVEELQAEADTKASTEAISESISECLARQLFVPGERDGLEFGHDKIREAAYASVPGEQAAALHRAAARAMEASPERQGCEAELARLWQGAGEPGHERRYRGLAGERAFRVGAYGEAIAHLERALVLRQSDDKLSETVRLERHLAEAHFGRGDMPASRRCIESLGHRAGLPMPRGPWSMAVRALADVGGAVVRHALAPFVFTRSPERRMTLSETARGYERLAHVLFFENELVGVTASSLRALGAASRLGPSAELARVYANLSISAALVPLHELAQGLATQAAAIASDIGDVPAQAWCRQLDGVYRAGIGEFPRARASFEHALATWKTLGDRRRWEETLTLLGMCLYQAGDFGQAAALRVQLEQAGRQSGSNQTVGWALIGRAEDALVRGQVDAASTILEEVDSLGPFVRRVEQMWMKALQARTFLLKGDHARALAAADQARQLLSRSIPTAFYVLEGHAALVEVYLGLADHARGAQQEQLRKQARRAYWALASFARVFPIARTRARLWRGMRWARAGRLADARSLWMDAIALGQRLGNTQEHAHDLALLWRCLADHPVPAAAHLPDVEAERQADHWKNLALPQGLELPNP